MNYLQHHRAQTAGSQWSSIREAAASFHLRLPFTRIFILLLWLVPIPFAVAQTPLVNYQTVSGTATGYEAPTVVGSFTETADSTDSVCLALNLTSTNAFEPFVKIVYNGELYYDDYSSYGSGLNYCFQNWAYTGTYTVEVENIADNNDTGTFELQYIKSGQPYTVGGLGGGQMTPGTLVSGSLNRYDYQLFTFTANAGDTVSIVTSNIVGEATNLTLKLHLFDPNGVQLATSTADPASLVFTPKVSGYYTFVAYEYAYNTVAVNPMTYDVQVNGSSAVGLQFMPVAPCRVADTRNAKGPFGGPELIAGIAREFDIPQSACSIPSTAVAYSLNVTAVPDSKLSYLSMWPSGLAQPTVSTLNSDGRVKANAAITPAGSNGGINVFVTDPSHVILDIDGYFVPAGTSSALAFYPIAPCRLVDTRNPNAALGGPSIAARTSRDFAVQSGNCSLPSDAAAYSLNVTAIPQTTLHYLTLWPTGQAQPLVSTLNSPTGAVTANGAIVPAGSNGAISAYAYDSSDVVIDVNGYFAAPSANGYSLYTATPCRVLDTRGGNGLFQGKAAVPVQTSACPQVPEAQAYVLNATVVPTGPLDYLTLWPDGETQPFVSTLNAADGAIASNLAIVPTVNGSVDAYSTSATQLILDISSYFAP